MEYCIKLELCFQNAVEMGGILVIQSAYNLLHFSNLTPHECTNNSITIYEYQGIIVFVLNDLPCD